MRRHVVRSLLVAGCATLIPSLPHAAPSAPSGPGITFRAPGATLWYEVRGHAAGRPMVVVNGGPGFDHNYELCSDAWDRLARGRRVVFYDQRGAGRSGPLRKGQSCTLADQISDLDALRAQLHAETFDLVGHSWGGYLVMAYAVRHPERLAHLVIVDSAAPKWTDTEFIFKYVYPEALERQGRLDFSDAALHDSTANARSLREYFGMLFVSADKRDEFLSRADRYGFAPAVNAALDGELGRYDMWPMLPTLTLPTLVLTGRFDMNVAPSTAWRIHKAIPGSRWEVFENSGHLPFFEEPEKFVTVVEGFLGAP